MSNELRFAWANRTEDRSSALNELTGYLLTYLQNPARRSIRNARHGGPIA